MLSFNKKLNKRIVFVLVFLFLIVNILFVLTKSELITHTHCDEGNCPICEVIYIAKESLKNVSLGNCNAKIYLALTIIVFISDLKSILFINDNSLVKNKVRLDC